LFAIFIPHVEIEKLRLDYRRIVDTLQKITYQKFNGAKSIPIPTYYQNMPVIRIQSR
jgi:hypothetical protein